MISVLRFYYFKRACTTRQLKSIGFYWELLAVSQLFQGIVCQSIKSSNNSI